MESAGEFTNRCACGWEIRGSRDVVVEATIDHGRRLHNMEATREQVLAGMAGDREPAVPGATAADSTSDA
jgi:hypothetical protein